MKQKIKKTRNIFAPVLILLVIFAIVSFGCKKPKVDPPIVVPDSEKPVISLLDTANNSQNTITFKFGFTDNKGVTVATLSVAGHDYNVLNKTSENIASLTASTAYTATLTVKDAAGNTANKSISFTTLANVPVFTAVINPSGSYDASVAAIDKVLPGRSVAKAFVLNVTTAGTVQLDVIGSLNGGGMPISYYWINGTDHSDITIGASTLSSVVPKTAIVPILGPNSSIINLRAGINVIYFKTRDYAFGIMSGIPIGFKITDANGNVYTNASYTTDPSFDLAEYIDVKPQPGSGYSLASHQRRSNDPFGAYIITPLNSSQSFDAAHFPKLCGMKLSTAAYPQIDFADVSGAGQNFHIDYLVSGDVFSNSNANYSNPMLVFSGNCYQTVKSNGGNYAYLSLYTNVYNTSTVTFTGTMGAAWLAPVSFKFFGNPETRVYNFNASGVLERIL